MLERIVAFDIEATGLDPRRDRIVELAFVRAADGMVLLHERFHPGGPIPTRAKSLVLYPPGPMIIRLHWWANGNTNAQLAP